MNAKHLMRRKVVTVPSHLTVSELAQVFADRCISGAPVVDSRGEILGVVSQTDLVRTRREQSSGVPYYRADGEEPAAASGFHLEEMEGMRVGQIMTPGAISVDEETPVAEVARKMTKLHIHRVLVTRRGRLCGIVTTMDVLRALAPAPVRRRRSARRSSPRRG
jgi:CBS domain-containing protein